ncbi:MAG: thioredoxin family protein [Deltaproteobacteria bacterium]|nr:thioredoxin family protein [Deltaproteobacteria bacterium]
MNTKDKCDLVDHQQELEKTVTTKGRVIALWYASWCPFCTKFLPIFEKHSKGEGRNFLLVRDDQESMGGRYEVEVFPTVLFFENGAVSKRLDGIPGVGLTEKHLVDFIAACP